jgi:tetratricopeptide (TPR) repeat protein
VRSDTLDSARLAIKAFRQAIELDPNYAAAYAGLALAQTFVALGTDEMPADALAAANEAIALAPDEAGGYVARGEIRLSFFWDWTGAQADFETALAIEPADSDVLHRYGALLTALGRLPQAIAVLKQATELDPLSARAWRDLGYAYLVNGPAAAARDAYGRARDVHPESSYAPFSFGREALLAGRPSEALQSFRLVARDTMRLVGVALAEQALGHDNQSQQALDELIAKGSDNFAYQIAEVYARRGDQDRAFTWLERAYQQRDPGLTRVKVDPLLTSLHSDARFGALLVKIHLQ